MNFCFYFPNSQKRDQKYHSPKFYVVSTKQNLFIMFAKILKLCIVSLNRIEAHEKKNSYAFRFSLSMRETRRQWFYHGNQWTQKKILIDSQLIEIRCWNSRVNDYQDLFFTFTTTKYLK